MNEEELARKISELILETYIFPHKHLLQYLTDKQINQLINARPKNDEFSILSGIVYWRADDMSSLKLACLATGVKCMPDIKLHNSHGKVIHDMHAEILCMRSFSWYLIDEIERVKRGEKSGLVYPAESGKFKLYHDVKICLYISELPCGDCSLDEMIELDPTPWSNTPENCTYRGRSSYTEVGKVRTKPGRRDSPLSLSKSCSDKLTIVTMKGLLKGIVSDLIANDHVVLDYIILPETKITKNELSLKRCFESRIDFREVNFYHGFKFLKCPDEVSMRYNSLLTKKGLGVLNIDREEKKKACDFSIVCVPGSKIIEVINGGVKNGNSLKNVVKSGKGSSILSRYCMMRKRFRLDGRSDEYKTYIDWKSRIENAKYTKLVTAAKKSLGNWGVCTTDDFALET